MLKEIEDYDWLHVFAYAGEDDGLASPNISTLTFGEKAEIKPFTREDVKKIIAQSEGENDGPSWLIYGQLKDKRWFFIEAGCDYTGWDCQAGGTAIVAGNRKDLERYGLTKEARERLGVKIK